MTKFTTFVFCTFIGTIFAAYEADWDSLDSRPLPDWFDKAKVGIFLHWGVYSVPSFGSEWFWQHWKGDESHSFVDFMEKNYPPNFTYQDFASEFKAEFFDPDDWVELFVKSGAKYVVLTSKHHEGYTLWPSKYSYSWNAKDVGPNRDLVGDFAAAVRKTDLHFGLYHSLYEWFNPLFTADREANWTTSDFVDSKVIPELKELVNAYEPELIWSDGDGKALDTYWKSKEFLAWLYNESPVRDFVVVNDRWGHGDNCKHGGYFTCSDRYNPGHVLEHKWENAMTVDKKSWGYRRNALSDDIMSPHELITTLTETISCGGNILINVGPTKEGTIEPLFQEHLLILGEWLSVNGEAIYESTPWSVQNDTLTSGVWYTAKDPVVYAITLSWPEDNVLTLRDATSLFEENKTQAALLGNNNTLSWKVNNDTVDITFPDKARVISNYAWVVKIS